MLPFTELFFYSTQRTGRLQFIFGISVLIGLWCVIVWGSGSGLSHGLTVPAQLIVAYSALCVLSLRLHDCGRSGWWAWLILGTALYADLMSGWIALGAGGFAAVCLGLLVVWPGQKTLNRHGPVPGHRMNQLRG